jgi:hypothetical protein
MRNKTLKANGFQPLFLSLIIAWGEAYFPALRGLQGGEQGVTLHAMFSTKVIWLLG